MIKPVLQDDDFLEDVLRAREELDHLHLWWLGQSGFLVQRKAAICFDPTSPIRSLTNTPPRTSRTSE